MANQALPPSPVSLVHPSRLVLLSQKAGASLLDSWALILTTLFGLVCLAAIGAPILTFFGLDSLARPIFHALNFICDQIPSHSFHIEGHQVGLCVHCLAIYSSLFVSGLLFTASKKRLRGIPWWFCVLLALPLAYDGFSQLFGLRESTWEIRLITGVLFGLGAAWFAFPTIQKGLQGAIAPVEQQAKGSA